MELNLIVLAGQLATEPEIRTFESGSNLLRLLVTVRSTEPRRRIDVIPVVMWDPPENLLGFDVGVGEAVWVAGSVQRRFWSEIEGRGSRIEIVAHDITFRREVAFEGVGQPERGEYPRPA